MKKILGLILLITLLSVCAEAGTGEHPVIQQQPSAEFEKIKGLVGKWRGAMAGKDGEPLPAEVEYKLTSGGTAVVEVLSPNSPHEMHSIYYNQNGKLAMTHYCMLGNRPVLALKPSEGAEINLDLDPSSGINVASEPHMHALKIRQPEPDHVIQEWTYYENGQAVGTSTFDFKRVV